jgi:hypothetical protein
MAGFFEGLLGAGGLNDLLGAGAQIYNIEEGKQDLRNIGQQAFTGANQIAGQAQQASQFSPFGIRSNTGGIQTDAQGGTNLQLGGPQQQLQNSMFGFQQGQANQLGQQDPRLQQLAGMGFGGAMSQFGNIAGAGSQFQGGQNQLNQLGLMQGMRSQIPTGFEGMSQQALQMGQAGLGQMNNPLQALQGQYNNLAQQSTQGLLQDRGAREQEIFDRTRAMQMPEEQRAQQNLDQQLFSQGRQGIKTAQYGGTPEQLARAKAVAEARNSASFGAMNQAGQEQNQDLQRALGLSSQAGSLAGQGEQLMGSQQGRALGLGGFGMQGTAQGAGLQSQYLQNALAAQQGAGGLAGLQQQLQQGQLGLSSGMFGMGQQAALGGSQQDAARLQNLLGGQQIGFGGENQLLNQLQATTNIASIADLGRRQGAGMFADTSLSGLEQLLASEMGAADMSSQYGQAIAQMLGSGMQAGSNSSGLLGGISNLGGNIGGMLDTGFGSILQALGGGN